MEMFIERKISGITPVTYLAEREGLFTFVHGQFTLAFSELANDPTGSNPFSFGNNKSRASARLFSLGGEGGIRTLAPAFADLTI